VSTLTALLTPDRTVYSDLPLLPGREPDQSVLQQVTDSRGIMRADFAAIFRGEGRRLDIFSWLPPHLNSKGYGYWFKALQPKVDVTVRLSPAELALQLTIKRAFDPKNLFNPGKKVRLESDRLGDR